MATIYASLGMAKGQVVCVVQTVQPLCESFCHELEVLHHYGKDGEHYCPTGFMLCARCGGIADEPEPYACELWGKDGN